jgi:hypothetical protein
LQTRTDRWSELARESSRAGRFASKLAPTVQVVILTARGV